VRLTQVALRNFKAVRAADIRPAALTLLIGRNNSGKSTILQALALLAQSAAGNANQIITTGRVDLGSDIHQLTSIDAEIAEGWAIQVMWLDNLPHTDQVGPGEPVVIGFELNVPGNVAPWSRAWVELQSPPPRKVALSTRSDSNDLRIQADQFSDVRTNIQGFEQVVQVGSANLWRFGGGVRHDTPGWSASVVADAQHTASRDYPQTIASRYLGAGIAQALSDFQYVGPARQFSRSQLGLTGQMPQTIASAEEIASALAYQRELQKRVSSRCRDIFEYGIEIQNIPPQGSVVVTAVDRRDRAVNAINMGSGFNQVAWMAAVLESRLMAVESAPGTTAIVGVEEPELHLHPAAQSDVAELLRIYSTAGVQILATTHSEHLLKALLRLVLKGDIQPKELGVLYMDGGKPEPLPVDDWGRLRGGLKGFFDANEQELGEHLDLLIEKGESMPPQSG
jgi:energy-coupling factor transporter ATP-binding protein EcfA2